MFTRLNKFGIIGASYKEIGMDILQWFREKFAPGTTWAWQQEEKPDFESMTKAQLEEYGREYGIELDRRKKKATLIEELTIAIKDK